MKNLSIYLVSAEICANKMDTSTNDKCQELLHNIENFYSEEKWLIMLKKYIFQN